MSRPFATRSRRAVATFVLAAVSLALVQVGAFAGSEPGEGLLRVVTSPSVDAPVRVDGEPRNLNAIAGLEVAAGDHLVCFGTVPGYVPPPCRTVTVGEGEAIDVVGRFERAGTLEVRTEPAGVGTLITVDGIARDAGPIRIVVPVGDHEVCFGPLTGHPTPECRDVEVTAGGDHVAVGRYTDGGDVPPTTVPVVPPRAGGDLGDACPAGRGLGSPFADVAPGNAHAVAVACAQAWGIVTGRSADAFAPQQAVTRAQAATMLHRLLERTGGRLPGRPESFRDVGSTTHRTAIEALAGAGIINGRSDGTFGPDQPVRRDQMAALLVRALDVGYGLAPEPAGGFADVPASSVHAGSVRRLVGAGITQGSGGGRYEPARSVSRSQMATFVMRLADLLVKSDAASAPSGVR